MTGSSVEVALEEINFKSTNLLTCNKISSCPKKISRSFKNTAISDEVDDEVFISFAAARTIAHSIPKVSASWMEKVKRSLLNYPRLFCTAWLILLRQSRVSDQLIQASVILCPYVRSSEILWLPSTK